jgi:hypothetical protein
VSDRRDAGIAQAPARDPGAVSFFYVTAQQYLAAYDANSLSGYVFWTLDTGCEFWGVDGSSRMIAAGRRPFGGFARAHFAVADAMALPFADETFNGVLCIGVIDPRQHRRYALERFSWDTIRRRTVGPVRSSLERTGPMKQKPPMARSTATSPRVQHEFSNCTAEL